MVEKKCIPIETFEKRAGEKIGPKESSRLKFNTEKREEKTK